MGKGSWQLHGGYPDCDELDVVFFVFLCAGMMRRMDGW
jgi:hypothetical protein